MPRLRHFGSGYSRFGEDTTGQDVTIYGDTTGKKVDFDASTNTLNMACTVQIDGTALTSTAAELNLIDNADRVVKVAKVALSAVDTAGGLFAWQNDEGAAIMVQNVLLDVTTKATSACTADLGTTATSAATLSDNMIDGVDVATAAGLFDSITDKGTNGKSRQKLADAKWVTGSVASGASAGIVGFAYIEYVVI
jgi:hypothetical protein